jgi:hypothetical protein
MRKVGLLATLFLGGCAMNNHPAVRPLRPLEIPTAAYDPSASAALTGTLMYEGGCLIFRDEQTGQLLMPIWPTGSSFNGTALLFHLPGKADQWLAVSQEVLMSGRPQPWTALGEPMYQPVEHQCGAYAPFFATAVRPAD